MSANQPKPKNRSKGQGVVEYCGALIAATVLVAVAMGNGVNGLSGIFDTIFQSVQAILSGHLPV